MPRSLPRPLAALVAACLLAATPTARAHEGHHHDAPHRGVKDALTIVAPKDHAVVGHDVVLRWTTKAGADVDHLHLYVDGNPRGSVPARKKTYVLPGLAKGPHQIKLVPADDEHRDMLDSARTITVVVK